MCTPEKLKETEGGKEEGLLNAKHSRLVVKHSRKTGGHVAGSVPGILHRNRCQKYIIHLLSALVGNFSETKTRADSIRDSQNVLAFSTAITRFMVSIATTGVLYSCYLIKTVDDTVTRGDV